MYFTSFFSMMLKMIPKFPKFICLDPKLMQEIREFTSDFEPYSDFNFTSLLCWDVDNKTEVSMLNHNLVISLSDYITGDTIYSLLGRDMIDDSMEILLGDTEALRLVPKEVINHIENASDFEYSEEPGSFDYIYNLEHLSNLSGGSFKKKRNKLNYLYKDIGPTLECKILTGLDDDIVGDLRKVVKEWDADNDISNNADHEIQAIERMFKFSNLLNLIVMVFYSNQKVIGFSVNEKLENDFAICHFEKALNVHKNIYTYIAQQTAFGLLNSGSKYVNWEQDLDIPGLKKAKMAYQPIKFLEKYQVKRSSGTSSPILSNNVAL